MSTLDATTGQLIRGNMTATPNAGITQDQINAAQQGGWSPISSSYGNSLPSGNQPATPTKDPMSPYTVFANNLVTLLSNAQRVGNTGTEALQGQIGGLERGQAVLGKPGENNPLNFIYNMAPSSQLAGEQSQMASIFAPAVTSIQGQQEMANQNLQGFKDVIGAEQSSIQTEIAAYNATKPNWTLSPTPNEDGEFYYYNTNTPAGQPTQVYAAGKIPPQYNVSPGGSTGSADSVKTLSASHNPYGIKMTSTTTDMYKDLGGTPGPAAVDGGNFWSFPDDTTGEKAARMLFTSSLYASDSVDQALRQWSNYTGKGDYPGYNGSILTGTGVDPNATVKSLSSLQVDAVMAAMKKAEAVGTPPSASDNSVIGKIAQAVASGALSYDQGVAQINGAYGNAGGNMVPHLLPAILKLKPDFNPNQSNAQINAQQTNTLLAGQTSALIEKTNGTLDMLDTAFGSLPLGLTTGAGPLNFITNELSNITGAKRTAINAYNSLLQEARAGLQAVLNAAAGLGVVTGGVTANSLLPDGMNYSSLKKQIAIAKQLEENTKVALANLANSRGGSQGTQSTPTTGVTRSGIRFTIQ